MWQNIITVSVQCQSIPGIYGFTTPDYTIFSIGPPDSVLFLCDFNTMYGVTVMHVYMLCNKDRSLAQTNNREFE